MWLVWKSERGLKSELLVTFSPSSPGAITIINKDTEHISALQCLNNVWTVVQLKVREHCVNIRTFNSGTKPVGPYQGTFHLREAWNNQAAIFCRVSTCEFWYKGQMWHKQTVQQCAIVCFLSHMSCCLHILIFLWSRCFCATAFGQWVCSPQPITAWRWGRGFIRR